MRLLGKAVSVVNLLLTRGEDAIPRHAARQQSRHWSMTKRILLIGRLGVVVNDVQYQLQMADIELFGGTGIDDIRAIFARTKETHPKDGHKIPLGVELRGGAELRQAKSASPAVSDQPTFTPATSDDIEARADSVRQVPRVA